jgi:opacity protein-like surface antigen
MISFNRISIRQSLLVLACAAGVPLLSFADHGQDFLLLEDYDLPAPGSGHITGNFEWEKYSNDDAFGLGPSLMIGVLPRTALSVDMHFRNEGDGFEYNSVMPAAHFQITSPDSKSPFKVGFSVGYQWTEGADEEEAESESEGEHSEHGHDQHQEVGHNEVSTSVHGHGEGIHNHRSDALKSRLVIEGDFGKTKVLFNLISVVPESGNTAWGYAAGVRHKIVDQLALGVEALGDFESDGWHELVAGAYIEPVHSVTLKIGAGFGLTEATPDFTLRTGFVWRF